MCVCVCGLLSGGLVSGELLFYPDIKEGGGGIVLSVWSLKKV